MASCSKCGAVLIGSGKFCSSCGAPATQPPPATPATKTAPLPASALGSTMQSAGNQPSSPQAPQPPLPVPPVPPTRPSSYGPPPPAPPQPSYAQPPQPPQPPQPVPPQPPQPGYASAPASPYGAPPYGAPAGFGIGARVLVQWADGNRYPAIVQQVAPTQALVAFPDGRSMWVENKYLTSAY